MNHEYNVQEVVKVLWHTQKACMQSFTLSHHLLSILYPCTRFCCVAHKLNDIVNNCQLAQVTEEEKRLTEEGAEDDEPAVGVDFVTFMMHAGKMDVDAIAGNAVDLMAAGVDTVGTTVCRCCY